MPQVLRFQLRAALASWGVGGAHVRTTETAPTQAAITGLLASALGLDRQDERQANLGASFFRAVRVDRTPTRFQDYHTVQARDSEVGRYRFALKERIGNGHSGASTRCGPGIRKLECCRFAKSSASASFPQVRWGRDS